LSALALLIAFKGLGYSISLGSFRGGPTFPAIFLGAAGGIMASHLPGFPVTAAVAVGIGAGPSPSCACRCRSGDRHVAHRQDRRGGRAADDHRVVVAYLVTLWLSALQAGKSASTPAPDVATGGPACRRRSPRNDRSSSTLDSVALASKSIIRRYAWHRAPSIRPTDSNACRDRRRRLRRPGLRAQAGRRGFSPCHPDRSAQLSSVPAPAVSGCDLAAGGHEHRVVTAQGLSRVPQRRREAGRGDRG